MARAGNLEPRFQGEGVDSGENFLVFTKLDTFCYLTVQTAPCYVPSFWHNTSVWQTDRQTDGIAVASTALAMRALRRAVKTGVRMNATDVTWPCAAVQYGLIMLTCGSWKRGFRHDGNRWDRTLNYERFGYRKTKTEPCDGFPQTPTLCVAVRQPTKRQQVIDV